MRLSVITVNLNNKDGLDKTLNSIFEQKCRDFEVVVIDGGSTDGSRDLLLASQGRINKWVSEKDTGIYCAMNKGIRMAEGDYIFFLNSGDCLYSSDTLTTVLNHQFSEDFAIFDIELAKNEGPEVRRLDKDPRETLIIGEIYHQAVFHRRSLFERIGMYDETFQLAADYEFFLKAFFKERCSWKVIHEIIARYEHIHGLTSDRTNAQRCHDERRKAQRRLFDPEIVDALEEQLKTIESLSRFRSEHEGLMQSKTVQSGLFVSRILRRLRKIGKSRVLP